MKFSTFGLTLLTVSTLSLAKQFDWKFFEKCEKNMDDKGCEKILEKGVSLLSQCLNDFTKECKIMESFDPNHIDESCHRWEKSTCKKILDVGIRSIVPSCKTIPDRFAKDYEMMVQVQDNSMKYICVVDESGKYCEFSKILFANVDSFSEDFTDDITEDEMNQITKKQDDIMIKAINETCKSKKCTKALLDIFDYESKLDEIIMNKINGLIKRQFTLDSDLSSDEKLQKVINYLKSDKCAAQATTENNSKPHKSRKCIVRN